MSASIWSPGTPYTPTGTNVILNGVPLAWEPAFGIMPLHVYSENAQNSLVGAALNASVASTSVFASGITGYGRNNNNGNQVYGVTGRADQYGATGFTTNLMQSFNYTIVGSGTLPPSRTIGAAFNNPIALTVEAGGSFDSSIGIFLAQNPSFAQAFLAGMYFAAAASKNYGIFLDAEAAVGPQTPVLIRHKSAATGISIQGLGTITPTQDVISYTDSGSLKSFAVKQNGSIQIDGSQVLGDRNTGWTAMTGTQNKVATYDVATVTLAQLAGRIAALQAALTAHGLLGV